MDRNGLHDFPRSRQATPRRTGFDPRIRWALALTLATLSAGCALTASQREAADGFARASAGIGAFGSAELQRMRKTTIEMNTNVLKLGGRPDPQGVDGVFDPEDVRIRVTAAEALSSYGSLLLSLVNESREEELAKASDAFVSAFNSLAASEPIEDRLDNLDAAQTEALGQLVRQIGGLFVEWQKARAVKRIVTETQPAVAEVIDLLIADFSTAPERAGMAWAFKASVSRLGNSAGRVIDDANASERKRNLAITASTAVAEENARLDSVVVRAEAVLGQLRAASNELADAMAEEVSIEQIRQLGGDLKTLADAARVVAGS